MRKILILLVLSAVSLSFRSTWGFFAHQQINRLAVFTLPPEMIGFYKKNIDYLSGAAVNPDQRRYVVEEEGPRHYLDADHYGDSAFQSLPKTWQAAVEKFGADTLQAHGILPWHIQLMYYRLRAAFLERDPEKILKVSAELGHYVSDAHVPLHTTENYNGQLTGQYGIHGLWESRLPELFFSDYDFFVGKASYIADQAKAAWQAVESSHALVDQVLAVEKRLSDLYGEKKYAFETRGKVTQKVYAVEYARRYHQALRGMVEKQMRSSVKMTGDFWFTAWVDAGQPDLSKLTDVNLSEEQRAINREEVRTFQSSELRSHE